MATETERRIPLNRERVLETALRLADEGGIEALSMRRLAQALGVEAMSLYNHVANKEDLLHGITDLVMQEFELPSGDEDWETALRKMAISGHDALLRHAWAANLLMTSAAARPARFRYIESLLRHLREAGFSPEQASHAYHAIDSHVLGFTLWQLGHGVGPGTPRITTKAEIAVFLTAIMPGFSADDYPYFLEHAEQHHVPQAPGAVSEFEFKLRLILDGLKRMVDVGSPHTPTPGCAVHRRPMPSKGPGEDL